MNNYSNLIRLVPSNNNYQNLEHKHNAIFYNIVPNNPEVTGAGLNKIVKAIQDMLENLDVTQGRIMFQLSIVASGKLKRLGAQLVTRCTDGTGIFLIDLKEYSNFRKLEGFTKLEMEDFVGNKVNLNILTSLPSYYGHRLEKYASSFISKVFNKKDIAFVLLDEQPDVDSQEKYITSVAEINRAVFGYYGINRIIVELPYDYDVKRLHGINHSFVGRFKEISKSFVVIYLGQNKSVAPRLLEKVGS